RPAPRKPGLAGATIARGRYPARDRRARSVEKLSRGTGCRGRGERIRASRRASAFGTFERRRECSRTPRRSAFDAARRHLKKVRKRPSRNAREKKDLRTSRQINN